MTVFLITLVDPHEGAWNLLKEKWPDSHHIVNDRLAFVAPPGIATSGTVKESIGISTGSGDSPTGVVASMLDGTSSGVLPTKAVAWLKAAKAKEGDEL